MPRPYLPFVWLLPVVFFSACRTPPPPQTTLRPKPVVSETIVLPGITISPVQRGDTAVAFESRFPTERTFPDNLIGANLAFTSNLRMPKMEAVVIGESRYQLRLRLTNSTEKTLLVTLDCIYEGEKRAARTAHSIEFPVETYRDVVFDLEGDPGRKLHIRANGVTKL